jgi:hypothetical protein
MKSTVEKDRHLGVNVRFRAPNATTLARWRAAAEADGRKFNAWLTHLANQASLAPLKKVRR